MGDESDRLHYALTGGDRPLPLLITLYTHAWRRVLAPWRVCMCSALSGEILDEINHCSLLVLAVVVYGSPADGEVERAEREWC